MLSLAACGAPGTNADDDDGDDVAELADNCPDMFGQDVVTEYRVQISDTEWAALQDEFMNREAREDMGLDPTPYHPVEFQMVLGAAAGEQATDVMLRLNGNSSWLQTVQLDPNPKMQFVISFNETNPDGRFNGVRKIQLDMPRVDQTFLHQRAALAYLRAAGLPAQCANSARLYINDEYYGLYTNLERQDKEFLDRAFEGASDGDLWKGGRVIKTNEETFTWDRIDAFWDIQSLDELDELADVDATLVEWAAEAVVGDSDGYYTGHANFFLYDHPTRGFIWLANDLDTVLDGDFLPAQTTPVFPATMYRWEPDWYHYLVVNNDPAGLERYVTALRDARSRFHVAKMQERIDTWKVQIADAAAEDLHKPFTMEDHDTAVSRMRDYAAVRADYIDRWLSCRDDGGEDADGDGFDMCNDCDDFNDEVHPGAAETCNLRDDDCDGRSDNIDGVSVCE
jgi:hypothetical protein